jgi:tetratricopeptide (TPR) repeat protein
MFTTTLVVELAAHAFCGDLTGVKQVIARIEPLGQESQGWRAFAELAQAQFLQLTGDLEAARGTFARCIATAFPDPAGELRPLVAWPTAIAGYLETLVSLERFGEARACGEEALVRCQKLGIGFVSHAISRALALAEGKLNDHAKAVARLEALIAEQKRLGVTGLSLGASYEARARIAIWSNDEASLEQYAKLTAMEYRHGRGSALGARWERLMAEARRTSMGALPQLADFRSTALSTNTGGSATEMVSEFLRCASTLEERGENALKLLCDDRAASRGYLYLVGDGGLSLVACRGAVAAPDGLLQYVQAHFDHELSQSGDQTAALTGTQMEAAMGPRPVFRDASGVDHQAVLMTSVEDGISRYAGVAVFVEGTRRARPASGATLVAALSAHLIRSGDTRGVA